MPETATNAPIGGYVLQEDYIMKRSIDLAFLAAIAITSVAIPVLATASPPTAVVRYGSTDLATPAAVANLHARIESAARQVCSEYRGVDLHRNALYYRCYNQAVAGGLSQIHNPEFKLASKALPLGVRNR